MTTPFLITGLPRSRTAWMATVASLNPESICRHEPIAALGSWGAAKSAWAIEGYEYSGISDSAAGFHLAEILSEVRPRTLVIERNPDDVADSLSALSPIQTNFCDLLARKIDAFKSHPLVVRIRFEDLADTDCVLACLRWLMPSLSFDRQKIEEIQKMNICVDMERVWRNASGNAADLASLIGEDAKRLRLTVQVH